MHVKERHIIETFKVYAQEGATKNFLGLRIVSSIQVTVSTKDVTFAGTDAHVYLNCGSIGTFYLNTIGEDDFEKGETRSYEFDTNCTLGELRSVKIELGHDNTGKLPGWCVSNVAIQLKFAGSESYVLYKDWGEIGWLAKDEAPYHTIVVELQEGS